MNILIDQSGYSFRNMGDSAMLQIAVTRLQKLWPEASIQVFTTAPDRLADLCPSAYALSPSGRNIWISPLADGVHRMLPGARLKRLWTEIEWDFRKRLPSAVRAYLSFKTRTKLPQYASEFNAFMDAIYNADLVVASGGGYLTDVFRAHADRVISTLELATKIGKPTVLLGQGLGPFESGDLLNRMQSVLPTVHLLTLREQRKSLPLLKKMGINLHSVVITGDDTIEMAYQERPRQLGNRIGINLRVANYSEVNSDLLETIRDTLAVVSETMNVEFAAVPISDQDGSRGMSDAKAIQTLLNNSCSELLDTPLKVIRQVGTCRIVVTGSYHAGVFALSQGVPIIALVKSEYYADKFLGLAEQFGVGCSVISLDNPNLKENLLSIITSTWQLADQLRPTLLEAAGCQIELAQAAYDQIFELVQNA